MCTNLTQFPILTSKISELSSATTLAKTLNINSASIQLGVA